MTAIIKVGKSARKQAIPKYFELDKNPNSELTTLDTDKGRKGSKTVGATLNYTPRLLIPPCNYHFRTTEKTGTIWEIRRYPGFSSIIEEVQFRFPQCWRHLPTKISLRECASERRDSGQMEILSGPPCLLRTSASVLRCRSFAYGYHTSLPGCWLN
ncbi:hypothetical protein ARMGADRAFT_78071 [Armillaria gallica]|uniref:Uncharacterized protein n=1 Tax=Armillaria gallica TaxID=47427 RepID=A0A2H3CUL5_ARMGA|nr:hypothetical protein ARMGADRAFT_78071 [Armillaria gallica]